MQVARIDNLKGHSFAELTAEEQREIASKGGKKSVEARARKKSMQEAAKMLLDLPVSKTMSQKFKQLGIDETDANNRMGILVAMLQKAVQGNVGAAQYLTELAGDDPRLKLQTDEYKLRKKEFETRTKLDAEEQDQEDVVIYVPDNGLGAEK